MVTVALLRFAYMVALPVIAKEPAVSARPNIISIMADDLGYGDLSCYGATKIQTPNVDRLAAEGVRFADAHSPSSDCTSTRYAVFGIAWIALFDPGENLGNVIH